MTTLEKFRSRVEHFIEAAGIPATRFGMLACNDPQFVHELRRGRRPNPDLMDRIDAWMASTPRPAENGGSECDAA